MEIPLLKDIVIIIGLALVVILIFQKLKVPPVLGLLVTGALVGPHGLSLIHAVHEVEVIAEIGVILLLFTIGMEFSLAKLMSIKKAVFAGGSLQVVITAAVTAGIAKLVGFTWPEAIFIGSLISLSSTALVLKLLQEKRQIATPQGNASLAILIFQDLAIVPLMLMVPMLAGSSENLATEVFYTVLKGAGVVVMVYVLARYVMPRFLFIIAQVKSTEIFILTIFAICFGVAWFTNQLGLSLALGAFLAGLIVSESEYSNEAISNIIPFREMFTSFFFISIGMLLDIGFFAEHWWVIILLTLAVILGKALITAAAAAILKYPFRIALVVGLSLAQVGEFSFVLSKVGKAQGLLQPEIYQYFYAVLILSMAATPLLINMAPKIAIRAFLRAKAKSAASDDPILDEVREGHLVIIGYGINGRNVARAAETAGIPYLVTELNAATVRAEKEKGVPIIYGDAIHPHLLHQLHVEKARVVVVAISDAQATRRIISNIRNQSKDVHVIVRTRYINEVEDLLKLGANEVIPEEFETSIEIFVRVMQKYLVPRGEIADFVDHVRAQHYEMLRPFTENGPETFMPLARANLDFACVRIKAGTAITNKPLQDAGIRQKWSINVAAIQRGEEVLGEITAETQVQPGDKLYIVGTPENIRHFTEEMQEVV